MFDVDDTADKGENESDGRPVGRSVGWEGVEESVRRRGACDDLTQHSYFGSLASFFLTGHQFCDGNPSSPHPGSEPLHNPLVGKDMPSFLCSNKMVNQVRGLR